MMWVVAPVRSYEILKALESFPLFVSGSSVYLYDCLLSGSLWKTPVQDESISNWSGCPCCPTLIDWSRSESFLMTQMLLQKHNEWLCILQQQLLCKTLWQWAVFKEWGRLNVLALLHSFPQILQRNESVTSKTADPPSSAILVVYLDKAEGLPVSQIIFPSLPPHSLSTELLPVFGWAMVQF